LITEFGTTFAYVSGPFSLWGRLLYFCSSAQNYISAMPNGYKTDLVLFSQISRTLQKETACKTDAPSSQKRSDSVSTSKASLHQTDFGLAFLQHNSALNDCVWPQTGLVYIAWSWFHIPNFLQESGLQKCPISPKNGENLLIIGIIKQKNQNY
jgi:hypothetical protein